MAEVLCRYDPDSLREAPKGKHIEHTTIAHVFKHEAHRTCNIKEINERAKHIEARQVSKLPRNIYDNYEHLGNQTSPQAPKGISVVHWVHASQNIRLPLGGSAAGGELRGDNQI